MAGRLSRNEGLLTVLSFLTVYVIAFYAVWKTVFLLFLFFFLANLAA